MIMKSVSTRPRLFLLVCIGLLSVTGAQRAKLRKLETRIDFLTGDVLDLKTDVNLLRAQMASMVNNSEDVDFSFGGFGASGINEDVQKKLDAIGSSISQLKKSQDNLKNEVNEAIRDTDESSKKVIAGLKDEVKELTDRLNTIEEKKLKDTHGEMLEFMATLKRAFKEHKFNTLSAIDELGMKLNDVPKKSEEPKIEAKDLEKINSVALEVRRMNHSMTMMNEMIVATKDDVEDLKNKVDDKLEDCCTREAEDYGVEYHDHSVTAVTKPTPAGSVTASPGGPKIKPIYGEDLKAHIKIGSRVVRGLDWSWGNQDGGGPGTVDSWYGGAKSTGQVMVTWDKGRVKRANYRIGAYGKYDLYLLA